MTGRGYWLDTFGFCRTCHEYVLRGRLRTDHADHYWTLLPPEGLRTYREAMNEIDAATTQQELTTYTD